MDNVTHSLAGLVLAEGLVRLRARREGAEPSGSFRTAAALTSLVAANLPDFDLLYTGFGGDRLVYMLHHRGHTHTIVGALIGAALLWGLAWLAWRWRLGRASSRADAGWLLALVVASTVGHVVLDWTNSYGVHPFWPFDGRWLYGDMVFIVEPWFWVVAVPALVASSRRPVARALLSLVLVVGLVLAWRVELVATGAAVALTVGATLSIALARMLAPGARVAVAIGGWVAVTLVMTVGASAARASTVRAAHAADPRAELLDVVVTPLPANPVCHTVLTVERAGDDYRVTTARASAAPGLVPASGCGARDGAGPYFRPASRPATPAVAWDAEWTAPGAELAALARESCPALAALRFIRVPAWRAVNGSTVMIGDVRYGGLTGGGFTDLTVPRRSAECPDAVPPWTPPRADVLGMSWPTSPADSGYGASP